MKLKSRLLAEVGMKWNFMPNVECRIKSCNNASAKNRTICHKCRSRRYKEKHPFRYYYNAHRQAAKRRHIPWRLSFPEFKRIWKASGHWEDKLAGEEWSMHRKDVNIGYRKGNVAIIPILLNINIFWEHDRWQIDFRWRKRWSSRNNKPIEDCPF